MVDIRVKDAKGGFDLPNMDKEEVHSMMQEQYAETGSINSVNYKDCHTKGIIIDREGFMYLQVRPINSRDNCGLIDSSWGSHLAAGDTTITSAMFESAREMGVATTVLEEEHFYPILENHPDITSELAITRRAAYLRNFKSHRVLPNGNSWVEPCELTLFLSYYDGKLEPDAKEGAGLRYFTVDSLCNEIQKHPEQFTEDIKKIAQRHRHLLVPYNELPEFNPNPEARATELVQEYSMDGNPLSPLPRKDAHNHLIEAFMERKPVPAKHRHVRVMLKRPNGTFYLQKRARNKKENAGLIDKPIGGHVGLGDIYDSAVIHECNDELAIPVAVLSEEDFNAVVTRRPEILKYQAVLMRVAVMENDISRGRTLEGGEDSWDETSDTAIYLGMYDGPITFKDGESTGVEVKSLEELKCELEEYPERYTNDLSDLIALLEKRGLAA